MAEKRMFTKKITQSDEFLSMPHSSQNLYFHLNMEADDEGFVNSPKKVMRFINASEDDLKILLTKRFILAFESGVIVIKHWKMHNVIRPDRLKETDYVREKSQLMTEENGKYRIIDGQLTDKCRTSVGQVTDKRPHRLEENSIEEISIVKNIGVFEQFIADNPSYEKPLREYKRMRVDMKKRMTPRAEELFIAKLKEFITKGYNGIELIDEALSKNWLSIYEPKKASQKEDVLPEWYVTESQPTDLEIDRKSLIENIRGKK